MSRGGRCFFAGGRWLEEETDSPTAPAFAKAMADKSAGKQGRGGLAGGAGKGRGGAWTKWLAFVARGSCRVRIYGSARDGSPALRGAILATPGRRGARTGQKTAWCIDFAGAVMGNSSRAAARMVQDRSMGTSGGVVSRSNARASRKVQPKNGDRGERAEGRGQGDPFRQDDRIYRMEDPGGLNPVNPAESCNPV